MYTTSHNAVYAVYAVCAVYAVYAVYAVRFCVAHVMGRNVHEHSRVGFGNEYT